MAMNNATYNFNHAHQRIAEAWGRILDACGIQRREGNKMYMHHSQLMIAAASIEIQTAMDIMEIPELSDTEVQEKLHRRLRDHLQEMLELVEGKL